MTLRGRLTLAVLALGVAGGLAAGVRACADGGTPEADEPVAAVLAPAPEPAPPLAPASVLDRQPVSRAALERSLELGSRSGEPRGAPRPLLDRVPVPPGREDLSGPLRVEYTLGLEATRAVWKVLDRGRVALGHVLLMDARTGALRAYVSTDLERFPPTRLYPAASLIKVITAAAAMDGDPEAMESACRFVGNKYKLTRRRVDPPDRGRRTSMRRALATSNNQCFAQLAVHQIGRSALLDAIDRFGLLEPAGPGHAAGRAIDPEGDAFALGELASGLDGSRITPLHAARLAATLADGSLVDPSWVAHVEEASGRALRVPPRRAQRRVLTRSLAERLRELLVETTRRGTARSAFRRASGRPLLQDVRVAGKTGSLTHLDPDGRYEWFMGVAPAEDPSVAIAVLTVHGDLYWASTAQVAAEVLKAVFCPKGVCGAEAAARWFPPPAKGAETAVAGAAPEPAALP